MEFNLSSLEPDTFDLRRQCKQVHLKNNTVKETLTICSTGLSGLTEKCSTYRTLWFLNIMLKFTKDTKKTRRTWNQGHLKTGITWKIWHDENQDIMQTRINWKPGYYENQDKLKTRILWKPGLLENKNIMKTRITWKQEHYENQDKLKTRILWKPG